MTQKRLTQTATNSGPIKLIYQCDPQKNTPAATTISEDIDGDGKVDKIVADSVTRAMSLG